MVDLRVAKQSITDDSDYTEVQQVCPRTKGGINLQPNPYSFYGKCPGGLNQYIDRIGVRSRKDNKFYPRCKDVTNKNRAEVEEEIIDFLMDGLSEDQLEEADIDPDVEYTFHQQPIADKFAGTFKPGTTDVGNKVTFWDPKSEQWIEDATVVDYKKTHGLGDKNFTEFILEKDHGDGSGPQNYGVRGEQFHPQHRENRNFPGLNTLFETEEERKEFLINCAKKLNLVKSDIHIEKADLSTQKSVLKQLGQITGKTTFTDIVTGTDPFIEKVVENLTKSAYEAVIIPDNGIRSILFIANDEDNYLIDSNNRVMKVSIDFGNQDTSINGTIIDGFITDEKDYYAFDLLYHSGKPVRQDYIHGESEGRLFELQKIIAASNTTKYPNSIKLRKPLGNLYSTSKIVLKKEVPIKPFIGPTGENVSLLGFIKENRQENNDILFVPQKGTSKLMLWKHRIQNNPIVVQLLAPAKEGKNHWIIGLIEKKDGVTKPWKLFKKTIDLSKIKDASGNLVRFKTNDFIKLRLNMMANGMINENVPYVNPSKVSKEEAKSFEETRIEINLITRSINQKVFDNTMRWSFANIEKNLVPQESSRLPLKVETLE